MGMTAAKPQAKSKAQPVPKLLEITVTAEILATATRKDSGHCAASDAVNATFPGARCETDLQTMTLTLREHGIRVAYLTPPVVQQALVDFDNGEPMQPFRFALRRVDAVQVRRSKTRDPETGKQATRTLPGVGQQGKRKTVKVGATRVAPTGRSRIPPVGLLANRKGRTRRYGVRQLETQKAAAAERAKAAELEP
jgi:hypothetical protein